MSFGINSVGIDFTVDEASASFAVGRVETTNDGKKFKYGLFKATTAAGDACKLDETTTNDSSFTPTAAATDFYIGISPTAHTDEYYGWLQIGGYCANAKTGTSVAAGDALAPSSTAGTLETNGAGIIVPAIAVAITDDVSGVTPVYIIG